jgi:type IV secretion system protein VirB9
MDARRILILAAGATLAACSTTREPAGPLADAPEAAAPLVDGAPLPALVERSATEIPYLAAPAAAPIAGEAGAGQARAPAPAPAAALSGRRAIIAANLSARAASREDAFVGGVRRFAWSPGRVFEVWATPLRVTTLSLGAGEVLVAKAAGDTVRWQIGEAVSGEGAGLRTHVLLKPLERGLETNLVLTTNRRVYLIDLKSGGPDGYNTAVAWDDDLLSSPVLEQPPASSADSLVALPEGELDAGYRIETSGRRPRWTPTAVFNDSRRTFITFAPDLQTREAPVLFVIAADGEAQMVNYRQAGGLFIVDRLFDRAELRLGDRRPQIVRLVRVGAGS